MHTQVQQKCTSSMAAEISVWQQILSNIHRHTDTHTHSLARANTYKHTGTQTQTRAYSFVLLTALYSFIKADIQHTQCVCMNIRHTSLLNYSGKEYIHTKYSIQWSIQKNQNFCKFYIVFWCHFSIELSKARARTSIAKTVLVALIKIGACVCVCILW